MTPVKTQGQFRLFTLDPNAIDGLTRPTDKCSPQVKRHSWTGNGMDTSRLRILLAGILAFGCGFGLLRTPVSAQDAVPNDLVGIWAHSQRDCRIKLSGKLDRGNISRMDQTPYQFIGFCKAGVDWLYQPVGCAASTVAKEGNGYRYSGKCREKDYPLAGTSFSIKRAGPNSISFADFTNQDFMIEGTYVRCSQSYECTQLPTAEELAAPPQ
jgi:hypothetical protein